LIFLSFRPLKGGSAVLVRGAHFRICSDGTLRGPDNTGAANFFDGLWYLGRQPHESFECAGPVYLRVTHGSSSRECIGPYTSIRVSHGSIYTDHTHLGFHARRIKPAAEMIETWQEVSFLTSRS